MSAKWSFLFALCAIAILTLPATASGPAVPAPADTQGCDNAPLAALALDATTSMTPVTAPTSTLPDPSPAELCWIDSPFTCWQRTCCERSGCGPLYKVC